VCLKNTSLHTVARQPAFFHEVLIESASLLSRRGEVEAGTASLAAIAIERELRNNEQRGSHINKAAVHLTGIIGKDAQVRDLVHQIIGVRLTVSLGNSQQDHQAGVDSAGGRSVYFYSGVGDPLYECSQELNIVVEREFVRVRAKAHRIGLMLVLVRNVGFQQVFCEDIALQQE